MIPKSAQADWNRSNVKKTVKRRFSMAIHSTERMTPLAQLMLPPRTPGLPIVGALPAFMRRPFDFLREARERNGDIFTLDLGLVRWVILNHPQQADYVLREHSQNYRKG